MGKRKSPLLPAVVPGYENKDLSTPRTLSSIQSDRQRKRHQRFDASYRYEFPETQAVLLARQQEAPADKHLAYEYRLVHSVLDGNLIDIPRSLVDRGGRPCPICRAPCSRYCACGYDITGLDHEFLHV